MIILNATEETQEISSELCKELSKLSVKFPVKLGKIYRSNKFAYDTSRWQWDVEYLLKQVAEPPSGSFSLWVVCLDLAAQGHPYIFGATKKQQAVISTFLLSAKATLSVAIHEIGHLLGLSHCSSECIMRPVFSVSQAEKRPLEFCENCMSKLPILL